MPAEWAPHGRCWMSWPGSETVWGERLDAARDAVAEVAAAIAEFEPVTMIANPEDLAEVSLRFTSGVSCLPMPHDDSWMRDIGPSFVIDGQGAVEGVAWRFNGWGEIFKDYKKDAAIAGMVLDHLEMDRVEATLFLEAGAFHVDGQGTMITTEQCILNPNRNPTLWREEIERIVVGHLGVKKIIWLGQGLAGDRTGGHVDLLACFVKPGVVLALASYDSEDTNYAALQENLSRLRAATDAQGRDLDVIEVEQPRARSDDQGRPMALSYVSLYIANGGVVMPTFEDPADQKAYDTVAQCFPDRRVVQVPALDLIAGGGGIHGFTLQQPEP